MNRFLFLLFVVPVVIFSQNEMPEDEMNLWQISQSAPLDMWNLFEEAGLENDFNVNLTHLNPFYYQADFDGDGKSDYIVLVNTNEDEESKLLVLSGNKKVHWLNRDNLLEYPSLTAWYICPKNYIINDDNSKDKEAPKLLGDAIMIIKLESSSALVYWNGKRFVSNWVGD